MQQMEYRSFTETILIINVLIHRYVARGTSTGQWLHKCRSDPFVCSIGMVESDLSSLPIPFHPSPNIHTA